MSIVTITKNNFEQEVLKSNMPVLIDFWASWCGPCRMISPLVDEIAGERNDVKVGKVNVDDEGEIAIKYGVMSIPTLKIFKSGEVLKTSVGLIPKEEINDLLDKCL